MDLERPDRLPALRPRAEINRGTWEALEDGARQTRDSNYAGIERALNWRHGSLDALMDGDEPEPLPEDEELRRLEELEPTVETPIYEQVTDDHRDDVAAANERRAERTAQLAKRYTDSETGELYTQDWERDIWDLTRFDAAERRKLIYFTRAERQRQEAERRRAAE